MAERTEFFDGIRLIRRGIREANHADAVAMDLQAKAIANHNANSRGPDGVCATAYRDQ